MKIHIGWVIYMATYLLTVFLVQTQINNKNVGHAIYLLGIIGGISLWLAIDK